MMSRKRLLNISVDDLSMNEAVEAVDKLVKAKENAYVVTPNVDHIIKVEHDLEFRKIYEDADLILTDGMPLIWISKFLKNPIKEKVSGSDLFPKICQLSAEKGYKMFLLGAGEGVAKIAQINLERKFPGLNICGTYSPPMGFENDKKELSKIMGILQHSQADILIVGLGCPKQEKFIYKYRKEYKIAVSLALGASIDFEAGKVKRAPVWMQKCGLEWFYRLCKEPKRMFKRYIVDDMKIFAIFIKYRKNK